MIEVSQIEPLAARALSHWGLEDATMRILNHSENTMYLVTPRPGLRQLVLRVHRRGYHSRDGIRSELAWAQALQTEAGVKTPQAVVARDGELVHTVQHPELAEARNCVLFEFIDGAEPDQNRLIEPFKQLGEVTARMHAHASGWRRPAFFERLTWDFDHCLGATPYWGSWRDGPDLDPKGRRVLERAVATIEARLGRFGRPPHRYGLIHGDIRLANLLIHDDDTRVIDFDDCGEGWHLYDAATAVSFIEHRPDIDELMAAWVEGYRRIGAIAAAEENEMWTFIMMRRLTLLAWIHSHAETETAGQLAPTYGPESVELAENYLSRFG